MHTFQDRIYLQALYMLIAKSTHINTVEEFISYAFKGNIPNHDNNLTILELHGAKIKKINTYYTEYA